jgi:lysine 6-dehydrogenase
MKFTIIGAGMQGIAAAYDIAKFQKDAEIQLFDYNLTQAEGGAAKILALLPTAKVEAAQLDVSNSEYLNLALEGATAVVSAVPYFLNPLVARAALDAGVHYIDFGGNLGVSATILSMHEEAVKKGISLIPDCGIAPGFINTIGKLLIEDDSVDSIKLYCGGLPEHNKLLMGYRLTFSAAGLINEYSGDCVVLEDGKIQAKQALSGEEKIFVNCLNQEFDAFYTSGGASTAPHTFKDRLKEYSYKTCRYPGHLNIIQTLTDLGFFAESPITVDGQEVIPRKVSEKIFTTAFNHPEVNDLILVKVITNGQKGKKEYELLDRGQNGFTAMERCTGFAGAIVSGMQATGIIAPGAMKVESGIPAQPFMDELAKREIHFKEIL